MPEDATTDEMRASFAQAWLEAAEFANPPTVAAAGQVLKATVDEQGLRLTSTYTGSSYWLEHWGGDAEAAVRFAADVGHCDGSLVNSTESRGKGYRRRGPLWQ